MKKSAALKKIAFFMALIMLCATLFAACQKDNSNKESTETEKAETTESTETAVNPEETDDTTEAQATEVPSATETPAKTETAAEATAAATEVAKSTEIAKTTKTASTATPAVKNTTNPEKSLEPEANTEDNMTKNKYTGTYSEVNGALGGIDALGREVPTDGYEEKDRKVGIFYFLWIGEHGTSGPYDNSKIVAENPDAITSSAAWLAAGGGEVNAHHFWGEPLFGYYKSSDKWVIRKHLQMLTDAGIDFICFDTTNAVTYSENVKRLIAIWYEYMEQGVDVPKLCFYTNSSSGATINALYKQIYNNSTLNKKYPRLDELWFYYEGKPMIVGDPDDEALSQECKDYFRIKSSVWPQYERTDDGFPWMEFGRLLTDAAVYGQNGRKEVANVSIAQHSATCTMSATAWYGANDRTRSWHDGKNDTSEDAIMYGYNFQEQWDWAIKQDPEMIFVTGWNEWVAQRQPSNSSYAIRFIDCCDPNTSRDAEPMRGLFGDNYYMQLIENIRKYKGTKDRVNVGDNTTIDIDGDFSQWDNVTAKYTDYKKDTIRRNSSGFGSIKYVNETGRNDFITLKAAKDTRYVYFYAETAEDITADTDENWMTLFINSGSETNEKWEKQFDYAVNMERENGKAVISKYTDGKWVKVGLCDIKYEGTQMMIAVPRVLVFGKSSLLDVQFKWADNYLVDEDGNVDIYSFYTNGDAAPIGRATYVFSEVK